MPLEWKNHAHGDQEGWYGTLGSHTLFNVDTESGGSGKFAISGCYLPSINHGEHFGEGTADEMKTLAENLLSSWLSLVNLLRYGGGETHPLTWKAHYPWAHLQPDQYDGFLGPFRMFSIDWNNCAECYQLTCFLPGVTPQNAYPSYNLGSGFDDWLMALAEEVLSDWLAKVNSLCDGSVATMSKEAFAFHRTRIKRR